MSDGPFQSLSLIEARARLERLFEQVLRGTGRVQITRADTDESCILISQVELESLEKALEILSAGETGAQMRQEVLRLAEGLLPELKPALASGVA